MQNKTRGLIEASLMAALTCIFAIVGTYIPFLTFVLFFIPIPFIILGKRHGMKFVVLSIAASAMIIGSLTEPIYSIFVVALPGIIAIVMGYMMQKEYSPSKVLMGGAAAALVSSLLSISLASLISGVGAVTQISEVFREITDMQMALYKSIGIEGERMEQVRKTLESTAQMATMIIPAAIMLSSVFFAYINYVLTIQVLKRLGYKVESLPPFKEFRLPKSMLMGTFLIAGLTMLTKYLQFVSYPMLVANVFVIFQFIYLIQGFAVISYFMQAFQLAKALRIFIMLFLLFNQMGTFMMAMIGFADAFVNFRKLKTDSE